MKEYYDRRAPEYDDWYLGRGLFVERERRPWAEELVVLERTLAALPTARTLDVACGTGFLTRYLPGEVVGLDQSANMLEVARAQAPSVGFVQGDAFELPFEDGAFDRVFTGHFYGHLDENDRARFLTETRRVASELIVCDAAIRLGRGREETQERVLKDGSRWRIHKRFFVAEELAEELGGGDVLFAGDWFVVVRSTVAQP